mmetsp:Transcript_78597/g.163323  ORF Transcript_78597/g.163323 Transcript_78597/m.163323 type:complete len:531 (+) Transcript_78597:272-1864(+)
MASTCGVVTINLADAADTADVTPVTLPPPATSPQSLASSSSPAPSKMAMAMGMAATLPSGASPRGEFRDFTDAASPTSLARASRFGFVTCEDAPAALVTPRAGARFTPSSRLSPRFESVDHVVVPTKSPCSAAGATLKGSLGGRSPGECTASTAAPGSLNGAFGTPRISTRGAATPASPRSGRKPGLTTFTDPKNPFTRFHSKQTGIEVDNFEKGRAGMRTRGAGAMPILRTENPASFPTERTTATMPTPEASRAKAVPHGYGSEGRRPGKATATYDSTMRSPRGMESTGVGEAIGAASPASFSGWTSPSKSTALGNYLNDMKRTVCAKRMVPYEPSEQLQRMNERWTKLPQDRLARPARSQSCEIVSPAIGLLGTTAPSAQFVLINNENSNTCNTASSNGNGDGDGASITTCKSMPFAAAAGRSSSALQRRLANVQSDPTKTVEYGFTCKRSVSGRASTTSATFLYHQEWTPSTAPTPRSPRQEQADRRFQEVISHMKSEGSVRDESKYFKSQCDNTQQILHNESVAVV